MKIQKVLALAASAMLCMSAVACDGGKKDDDGLIKVGIINNDPNESGYRTANDNDMKKTFTKENGYDAQFSYSLKNDEQINAAQKYVQDEVDYLLLSAADTAGWDSVLQDAKKAGVKVILFDRTIDADASLYEASIVSDMDKEGQTAVDWLKGQNLSEYNIIHLQGVMGSAAQKGRSGALDQAVKDLGWNLITQQTAEWNAEKATQIVQSVIDSGKKFNVIYAEMCVKVTAHMTYETFGFFLIFVMEKVLLSCVVEIKFKHFRVFLLLQSFYIRCLLSYPYA